MSIISALPLLFIAIIHTVAKLKWAFSFPLRVFSPELMISQVFPLFSLGWKSENDFCCGGGGWNDTVNPKAYLCSKLGSCVLQPGRAERRSGRLGSVQGICVMAGEVAGSSPRSLWLLRVWNYSFVFEAGRSVSVAMATGG